MKKTSPLQAFYEPAGDHIAREIDGEFVIVPLSASSGEALFCLNETGKAIWGSLDGKKSVAEIIRELSRTFKGRESVMRKDVIVFIEELKKRGLLRELKSTPE